MIIRLPQHTGYILHERADQYHAEGEGFLSIKSFYNGQAHYTSGRRHHLTGDQSYLILNNSQPYTIEIESEKPVESFCVFFAPEFARMVFQSAGQSLAKVLDAPDKTGAPEILFFDRTYPHDNLLSPRLFRLREVCTNRRPETGWLVEQFHDILMQLLKVHSGVTDEVEAVPAVRAATRAELYRRLYYAKDFADALFTSPITISQMAEAAGISSNHLLRAFRQVFHQSPYEYITSKRLEYAKFLLLNTNQSVTDICMAVGFESLGAFSWLFRRKAGISPLAYRTENR